MTKTQKRKELLSALGVFVVQIKTDRLFPPTYSRDVERN